MTGGITKKESLLVKRKTAKYALERVPPSPPKVGMQIENSKNVVDPPKRGDEKP